MLRAFKIFVIAIWAYELVYGIVKCVCGEYIHPVTFTITVSGVLLLLITNYIREEIL